MSSLVGVELVQRECSECGIVYGLPSNYDRSRREGDPGLQSKGWYCPNGHSQVFRRTEVQRLRDELERAQRAAIAARDERDKERERADHLIKRGRAALCPFGCRRTFVQLARHIKSKHPTEGSA